MDFDLSDIRRLYGDRLYIVPAQNISEDQAEASPVPEDSSLPGQEPSTAPVAPPKPEEQSPEVQQSEQVESQAPVIPQEVVPPKPVTSPPFEAGRLTAGKPVQWKLRPTAKMVLVLSEEEFRNRQLTGQLKVWVEQAGIPIQEVGFGVFDGQDSSWDFSQSPLLTVLCFHSMASTVEPYYQVGPTRIWMCPSLAHGQQDANASLSILNQLKQAYQTIS
ncbi:hypothetical protein [Pontibacter sp. G13]|uniref:hypothetical protein n=1 Tax=Pontibacter sp. G13 TaxID=3074898 RepID=UPI00288BE007|nr:hypothetical protein [Pontibacter sp. G13]WNJ16936.1 hypothetical protein RJD25_18950 [Pontibacter sp. G13]